MHPCQKIHVSSQLLLAYCHDSVTLICETAHINEKLILALMMSSEAEHHERALAGLANVRFRIDRQASRYGILTTEEIKYAMMTLTNNMLRDQRIAIKDPLVSEDPESNRRRLKEQLTVYSFQFKAALNCFGKQRVALCGKVGGMKDDVCIALQLAIYYSSQPQLYA